MPLTKNEISRNFAKRRKENGLCPRCGNVLDRDGYYCSSCLKNRRLYESENRAFFARNHLCTECGKERVFGSDRMCFECREKMRKYKISDEAMKRMKEKHLERSKKLYKERSEKKICTRCGKRNAAFGRKKCEICLAKQAEQARKRNFNKKNIREHRKENRLCYYCGNPIGEEKVQLCASCLERCRENGLKSGGNDYWRADNKIIFLKK